MLFQSDYWVASNNSEKTETIQDFLSTDEGIKELIIIDMNNSNVKSIIEYIIDIDELECNINLIINSNMYKFELDEKYHTKNISVYPCLDDKSIDMIKKLTPILGIFV